MSCSKQCFEKDDELYGDEDCATCLGRDDGGTVCQRCSRSWFPKSEQGASVRIYGHCIVCCMEKECTSHFR